MLIVQMVRLNKPPPDHTFRKVNNTMFKLNNTILYTMITV